MKEHGFTARRPALGTVAALLLFCDPSTAEHAAIERCREAGSDEERIACLERALAGGDGPAEAAMEPGAAADPGPRAAPATPPPEAAAEEAERESAPSGIGSEQVRARNEAGAEREARLASATGLRVAGYSEVPYQRLQIELENGQVWRQIKGDTQHIRVDLERNQTVDIEESTLGGYKLSLNEMRRTIRVERIR